MEEQKEKTIIEDNSALMRFFEGVMTKATTFVMHFDTQANILIGINLAVLGISLSSINGGNHEVPLYFVTFFSFLSLICSLYTIHPPSFLRKRGQKESLFYNKKINSFSSPEEYSKAIVETLNNKDDLILNYSTEIYNLYKYSYRPKRNLFKISRNLLMIGIFSGLIVLVVQSFYF
jgi:hypothetical protein